MTFIELYYSNWRTTDMGRPFAVLDIDGTLVRWQLYHALADKLASHGHLDQQQYKAIREARLNWKKRAQQNSFADYESALVAMFDSALVNIKPTVFEQASREVVEQYKQQVYNYTRDLIAELKATDYWVFAISASPSQVVKLIAEYYGFDDFRGSTYDIQDGRFSGQKDVLLRQRKPEVLEEMIERHSANWSGSIAVGDSESDIPMLESVARPIAFNPTQKLFEYSRSNKWEIVVERKNVIYKLEARDGLYVLA